MNDNCQVVWNLTSKCNQKCKFCFRKKSTDISLEKNKKIVDKLSNLKIKTLSISGGEALLYNDIFYLLDYIKIKLPKTKLILNTNCQGIEDNMLNVIISKFDALTLPIESVDSLYNSEVGRGSKHIENVLRLLEFCNDKIESSVLSKRSFVSSKSLIKICFSESFCLSSSSIIPLRELISSIDVGK